MTGFNCEDLERFEQDLQKAAYALGSAPVKNILVEAMKPVEDMAVAIAPRRPGSGRMAGAIKTYATSLSGRYKVTTGVHRKDFPVADTEYYPAFVEYGHGGPRPAPPHPFLRPAFNANKEGAYQSVAAGISVLLKENGL